MGGLHLGGWTWVEATGPFARKLRGKGRILYLAARSLWLAFYTRAGAALREGVFLAPARIYRFISRLDLIMLREILSNLCCGESAPADYVRVNFAGQMVSSR